MGASSATGAATGIAAAGCLAVDRDLRPSAMTADRDSPTYHDHWSWVSVTETAGLP